MLVFQSERYKLTAYSVHFLPSQTRRRRATGRRGTCRGCRGLASPLSLIKRQGRLQSVCVSVCISARGLVFLGRYRRGSV